MSATVAVYNSTNSAPVGNGAMNVTSGGQKWGVIDARCRRLLNEPGDGTVTIPLDHPNAAALTYRNVVRIVQDGEVIKAFIVNELKDVIAATNAGDLVRTASGEGLLSRLKEIVRVTPNPIDELPVSYTRRHDWAAPETSAAAWNATIYTQNRKVHVLNKFYRPVAWPTPVSPEALGVSWIYTRANGTSHPAGTVFWHREFDLDDETEVAFFVTAADQFELAIDGVSVLTEELNGPNSVWWNTYKAGARLAAGTHTVRIKQDVINSGGQAGMIFAAFATGPAGINNLLFVSGNGSPGDFNGGWKAIESPLEQPGQTAGKIIRLGMDEAANRGVDVPTLNFSDTVDSNGDAFLTLPFSYRVPCTEWEVLTALSPWIEWQIADDGYELSVYSVEIGRGDDVDVELDAVTYTGVTGKA